MSRPARASGIAAAWIGKGDSIPWVWRRATSFAGTPRSAKVDMVGSWPLEVRGAIVVRGGVDPAALRTHAGIVEIPSLPAPDGPPAHRGTVRWFRARRSREGPRAPTCP